MKTTRLFAYLLSGSFLIGASACGGDKPTLTRAHAADPATCASGGTVIDTGLDKNENGVLEDTEVTQTTPVCNGTVTTGTPGANGKAPLIQSSALPPGDPSCPAGGSKLEIGYDDGSGGGTAGDGILQAGEVTSSKVTCSFGQTPHVGSLTPPEGPAGVFTIETAGGDGTTGNGGNGNQVNITLSNGSLGGHVKVFNTGAADSSFTMPAVTFIPGSNPVLIDTDTTLNVYANDNDAITSGDMVFLVDVNQHYLRTNIEDVAVDATSLDIAAGVTFTVPNFFGGPDYAFLTVSNADVRNAGTIRFARKVDGKSAPQLEVLFMANYFGLVGSTIDAAGSDVVTGVGGAGSNGVVLLYAYHAFINEGTILSGSGSGDTPGAPTAITEVVGGAYVVNTGTISARGGNAAVGGGGNAGPFYILGGTKGFYSSGTIDVSGGDGVIGSGVGTSQLYLSVSAGAAMKLSGTMKAKGGTCSAVNCTGGKGGTITISAGSTPLFTTATIDTSGGAGKGVNNGGAGGPIGISGSTSTGGNGDADLPAATMQVSGDIIAKGGAGATGGAGGNININLDVGIAALGQELILLGYTAIKSTGGTTATGTGGKAGFISVYAGESYPDSGGSIAAPGGSVVNYVDITTRGGNGGTAGNGGTGGNISLSTQASYPFGVDFERVINHGHLLAQGGDATRVAGTGGLGGAINLTGLAGIDNQGALSIPGGNATATNGVGGASGQIYLYADYGAISNKAVIEATGGSNTLTGGIGGTGGEIYSYGLGVTSTAMISAKGGTGGATTTGIGGSGGYIYLLSSPPGGASSSTYDVSGGTGITVAGVKGSVFADGVDVTP